MKKKQEVVIKLPDAEAFAKYTSPEYNKFWGHVEVLDPMIKKFLETKDNAAKTDFIACEKEFTGDLFAKYSFSSKPKYFILHKGSVVAFIDGLDLPKLIDEIEKNFGLLDA